MDSILSKIAKLQKFQDEIKTYPIELSKMHESQMIDWNQTNLYAGIDSEGDEIYPDYTDFTKDIKFQLRQPTNRVTLKDTGYFYRSIELEFGNQSFFFKATDYKYRDLQKKYGSKILGITDEDLIDLRLLILPDFIDLFRIKTL